MARFSEEWLSRLLEKSDIVDVVSAYVLSLIHILDKENKIHPV